MISRTLITLAVLCAAFSSLPLLPAAARALPNTGNVHVIVTLSASPLGADPNLRIASARRTRRLNVDSTAARSYARALDAFQRDEMVYLRSRGIDVHIQRRFHLLVDGFSASVPQPQLVRLRTATNVVTVLPVHRYRPLLDRSIHLVHAPQAWKTLGGAAQAGRGVMIANIDSGIDITHPCFRDTGYAPPAAGRRADSTANLGLTNNKVIVARAFGEAGKQYSAADRAGEEGGHGTFTAAIEACDYHTMTPLGTLVSGVAPAAYLMNYNIFPDGASVTSADDPVIPALEAAVLDGADVINLSFGDTTHGSTQLNPDVQAIESSVKNGIVVVAAAGNAGPTQESIASPATAPDVIAVGSTSNEHMVTSTVDVTIDGGQPQRFQALQGTHPFTAIVGPSTVVLLGKGRRPGDDSTHPTADDLSGKDVRGKVALLERGAIPFSRKLFNVQRAGAIGAIVFDNIGERHLLTMDAGGSTIPALFVSLQSGSSLSRVTAKSLSVTLDPTLSALPETPNVLSDFSSRGYGSGYSIKPDLVAPGEDIYSAAETRYPGSGLYSPNGFASASGTSFSAPHVSGAVALLRQRFPTWTPSVVKSVLMGTARETVRVVPSATTSPSVMMAGSGLVDAAAAVATTSYATPASISFGSLNPTLRQISREVRFTLSNIRGDASFGLTVRWTHASPAVKVSLPSRETVTPGGSTTVPISVTVGPNAPTGNYDGYLEARHGSYVIHLPFFVHVARQPVRPGSILVIDNSTNHFITGGSIPPKHHDLSTWYRSALRHIGRSYTYWNESILGPPSLTDLQRASAVVYFTGANLNGWVSQSTQESLLGPVSGMDLDVLQTYLRQGGRLFVSGMGVTLSDFDWSSVVLGAAPTSFSAYDSTKNDRRGFGGISPPRPSAVVDGRSGPGFNRWIFAALKPIDISTSADGARDMLAIASAPVQQVFGQSLVGVPALDPVRGNFGWQGKAFGQAALRATGNALIGKGKDVAIVSSDEPGLNHRPSYAGRSVVFSFGFESINNSTGYATREQVLQRVLRWLEDRSQISVSRRYYRVGKNTLTASITGGEHIVHSVWRIGARTYMSSGRSVSVKFAHPGRFDVRLQVLDSLGHTIVSPSLVFTVP